METSNFRRLLRRALLIPLVLLVLLSVVLIIEVLSLTSSMRWAEHSDQVIAASRQAMRYMLEMESSLRGYDLTRDKSYLERFERAKSNLPASIDSLVQLTADNRLQQYRLKDIRDLDKGWMEWARQEIAKHSNKPPTENELLFGAGLMEEIHIRQREVVSEEERLLRQRSQRANILSRVVLVTAVALGVIVAVVLVTITRRELRSLTQSYETHLEAEAERARELQESRESFRITLNSLAEGVLAADARGCVTFINPVAQRLTGWEDADGVIGHPVTDIFRVINERERSEIRNPIQELLNKETAPGTARELAMMARDGREFPVEVNAAPILNDRHELAGTVIVFRDIGQRRQTEETLRASERLTQAGRLSATIAHEIRNPLDTVTNLIYLMQHEKTPGPITQQYLQMANDELARITQITGQLLTFHREARHPVEVSLKDVLESVLTLFAPQIRKSKITVEKHFEASRKVRGFPGELRQVFSNLVGNAIDAMPNGGRLILRLRESSLAHDLARKGLRVTIIDTGHGISLGVKCNLFAPFYTTKGEKGTGLGLWVSRGIVEKHEGTIHVISTTRNGRSGTAFSVFLPFQQVLGKLDVPRTAPAGHA